MTLEQIVDDIRVSMAQLKERLEHTVTWKELVFGGLVLFFAMIGGVWLLNETVFAAKLTAVEARLEDVHRKAIEDATETIRSELSSSVNKISTALEVQNIATNASKPIYMTVPAAGNLKEQVFNSPEWEAFAREWSIDLLGVIDAGQISIPIDNSELFPK